MDNESELIKLAKTRRAMGYSMWPSKCSKCGTDFQTGRHLVEDAKVYSYCNDCYEKLENLVRTGINDVFIQPERLNPKARKGCDSLNSTET